MASNIQSQVIVLPRLRSAVHHRNDQNVPMHTHDADELVFALEGRVEIDVGAQRLSGSRGTLFLLPAEVPHNQVCHGAWHTLCVLFYGGRHLLKMEPRAQVLSDHPEVERWLEELCRLHSSQDPAPESVANALLLALLTHLSHTEDRRRRIEALHPRLAQALKILHEHAAEELSAEDLATATHTSYSHLSALFRERFGCGPLKYQQDLRMQLARKLLLNPYLSIDEVAGQAGYADCNYFVRLFRQTQGVPPGKWRKRAQS